MKKVLSFSVAVLVCSIVFAQTAFRPIIPTDGDTGWGSSGANTLVAHIAGADDFTFSANTFTAASGSTVTMASGSTLDLATGSVSTAAATVGYGGATSTFAPMVQFAAQQALSGAGAITITQYYSSWSTSGAQAGTLANGTAKGQLKKIQMIGDGGDGTLTPVTLTGGTTIVFADAGDYVILIWSGTSWVALELGNDADGTSAPVLS